MSEHILKFLLSELKTVRIRCRNCVKETTAFVEVPLDGVKQVFADGRCPICREFVTLDHSDCPVNPLCRLADAIDLVQKSAVAEIEFVLPQPSK